MAYDNLRERQRVVMVTALGPDYEKMDFIRLVYSWLEVEGFTQPTYLERLQAYATFKNVAITVAEAYVGLL